MPQGLILKIGADVSEATAALKSFAGGISILENQLARLKKIAELPGLNLNQLNRINALISKTDRNLRQLKSTSEKVSPAFSKFTRSTNQSTLALTNLGRVVQDAPFGFLGIANNLNPLLESFQRLKQTTGTAGGALKALGSSLLGAGGLGFALSIVSTGLIVFGDKIFGMGPKAKAAAAKVKEAAEALKELIKPMAEIREGAIAGATAELVTVNALSTAVLDQTKSYNQRNAALNQLKEINKAYFGDLTLEKAELGLLKIAVDEYTKAIINAAIIKGFESEIGKVAPELAKQEKEFNKASAELKKYNEALKNTKETSLSLTGESRITQEFVNARKAANSASSAYSKQAEVVGSLRNQMFELRKSISEAINVSLDFKPLKDAPTVGTDKDPTAGIIAQAKKVADFLKDAFVITYQFNPLDTPAQALAKAQKFLSEVSKGDLKLLVRIESTFSEPPTRTEAEKFVDPIEEQLKKMKRMAGEIFEPAGTFDPSIQQAQWDWDDHLKDLAKIKQNAIATVGIINGALIPAFDNLFNAIQAGENPLKAFFQGIGQAVLDLIKKLIQAAITAALLSALVPGSGSFGTEFGKLLGFQFAGGGLVSGPTLGMIGEGSGTSLSNPEVIAPLDQLKSMLSDLNVGNQRVQVAVTGRLRGRDIALQNARTSRTNRRLGA